MIDGPGYLAARLVLVERRVRRAVAAMRAGDPSPDDPMRGLYLAEDSAWYLLDRRELPLPDEVDATGLEDAERRAAEAEADGVPVRLRRLAIEFALAPVDVELLLVAMLPDVDARYEQLYGYLNDDVSRRRATVGLALRLCGLSPLIGTVRARLADSGPLVAAGLLVVEEPDRPMLTRSLRVPDRVTGHLLGDDTPDALLTGLATIEPAPVADRAVVGDPAVVGDHAAVVGSGLDRSVGAGAKATLPDGIDLLYLRQRHGGSAMATAVAALARAHRPAICLDLPALLRTGYHGEALDAVVREARLRGAGIVAGPVGQHTGVAAGSGGTAGDSGAGQPGVDQVAVLRTLTQLPVPVLLTGPQDWDPDWTPRRPVPVTVEATTPAERAGLWLRVLADAGFEVDDGLDAVGELSPYVLDPEQTRRSAMAAVGLARLAGSATVSARHLHAGVRGENGAGLQRLARRIEPAVGWDDLVLPKHAMARLHDLARRVRHRDLVLGTWRMRPGGGRGRGVTGLFAGDSGTGKTMAAEVVAADLGLDLYVVDLSTVVDKYVGQTEKNLERIFTEAAGVNGVLLFDEADAIFAKRSEIGDSHDRYANLESAYLLQRMESFDGVAILTTNLRANLDEAFTRRLDVIVDFPLPDAAARISLWQHCLSGAVPVEDDLDLRWCAERFELSGGAIRSCALTAGYLAAEAGRPVTTADLVEGIRQEYRKLGRLVMDSEFGP